MKIATIIALFAVVFTGSAFAAGNGNGCKLQGTWVGETPYPLPDDTPLDSSDDTYYMLRFFSTFHGIGDNEGTEVAEWANAVPDPGTSWSNARGVWKKSGPNQYTYTKIGYIYDTVNGDILFAVRHAGTLTLTDCNTITVNSTVEYLLAGSTPIMCVPLATTLHRVTIQQPCEP